MIIGFTGHGGGYELVRRPLTDKQISDIAAKIQSSQRFNFGELSHVVLSGTDTIIGYVGNDSVELCCPEGENPEKYRTPHSHLRRIFMSA